NSRTDQLVRQYYPYIARLVQSIIHDPAEAEDIAQETFIAAMLNIDNQTSTINYKAWLSKIAVNKARDLLRRRKVRHKWQQFWQAARRQQTDGRLPEELALQNEITQQLWLTVETLNENHRLPIILRYGHNLSIREIASLLDLKEGTVHSRLHNAQKKLAHMLELDVETILLFQGGQL
ncbi:MAG: RNA polymerase sigma factor, partial [Chloroflexi bacterium]|nr:RNA polymerase sigma factor [Chloroflexota bacterium]